MTLKVDGTNGVLQAYDAQTLTTGFSYTFAAGTQTLVITPAGTLATGTVTMPASPVDGMVVTIESTQQVTALTVAGNTGQTMTNGTITLRPNQPVSYMYRLSNTTWYPYAGAANSQIVSGTAVASTSGTSIDFTSIPSWVKRITVMLNGVSTSGSAAYLIQLGSAGGVETSGYVANTLYVSSTANVTRSTFYSNGFGLSWSTGAAGEVNTVTMQFTNLGGNIWTGMGMQNYSTGSGGHCISGQKTLSGTLDRVRITTTGGTDTFDAGSINILYE